MENEASWSLGTVLVFPLMLLVIAAIGAVIVYGALAADRHGSYGWSDRRLIVTWASVVLVIWTICTAASMWPYSAEYHKWTPVEGTVAQIDNRLIGTGDGMETKFVVTFTDGLGQYGCDDTRCASVREGDYLSLSCKRAWQFTGTDGYDCRFFATEAHR